MNNFMHIAYVAHNINKAYCDAIGDKSQKSWEEAEDWQRESAAKGVFYAINNSDVTPEDLHEKWCLDKLADGWVWGEIKDAEAKTHPCLVPYEQLPKEQRVKDHLFKAVVESLKYHNFEYT
ncbi:MAG: RyR domain-containing protein [Candidatus Paceibacterota bacterium]